MDSRPWIARLLRIEKGEAPLLLASAGYFFCLLLAYYILRPIRETAGIAGEKRIVQWLFFGTFCVMLLAVPCYGALVARLPRVRFIAGSTIFFALNLVLFVAAFRVWPEHRIVVGRVFFVWLSVFNLFVVSIFWSLMVERWPLDAGKRLFGAIAAGGSFGQLCGSRWTSMTARRLSEEQAFLIAALVLLSTLFFLVRIARHHPQGRARARDEERPLGGGMISGLLEVVRSSYLTRIGAYLFAVTICGTIVYFIQIELVRDFSVETSTRRRVFADINSVTAVVTLLVQLFGVRALIRRVGVGKTLGILPWVYIVGFAGLALMPGLLMVAGFEVLRRSAGYGVASPTREVLFTVLAREEKYKAKSFIDTVVYRGGDVVGAQAFAVLLAAGVSVRVISGGTIAVCVLWLGLSLSLGRALRRREV